MEMGNTQFPEFKSAKIGECDNLWVTSFCIIGLLWTSG